MTAPVHPPPPQVKRLLAENDVEKARSRKLDERSRRFARELAEATAQLQRSGVAPAGKVSDPVAESMKPVASAKSTPAKAAPAGKAATGKAAAGKAAAPPPAAAAAAAAAAAPAAADNQLVAALQSEDGRKELKALFVSLDRNDDEKVDQIEWGRGLAKNQARRDPFGRNSAQLFSPHVHPLQALLKKYFGGEKVTMKELGAMFKTIDTSGDGFVSFDEMVAAARKASPPQSAAAVSSADEIDDDDFATS